MHGNFLVNRCCECDGAVTRQACTVARFASGKCMHEQQTRPLTHSRDPPARLRVRLSVKLSRCMPAIHSSWYGWTNSCIVSMCGHLPVGILALLCAICLSQDDAASP